MIRCLLPASVALHVVVIGVIPSARAVVAVERPTSVIEVANEPPPPPPVPTSPPDPAPASAAPPVAPRATRVPIARMAAGVTGGADAPAIATSPEPIAPSEATADFTGSVLSNAAPSPIAAASAPVRATAPSPPRFVPATSLARPPRAPGLDAELERNYPAEARRAGIAGKAVLRVRILPDGRVASVEHLSESYAGFADACARTVRAAKWEPPIDAEGRAVGTEITYVCRFEVRS